MLERRSAICLVIDRLSAAYVGALGNTWIHTPALDRLAAESIVFDRAMIDSPAIADGYHSYWTGEPAWQCASRKSPRGTTIAQLCRDHALPTRLITDDDEIAKHPLAAAFDDVIHIAPECHPRQAADWQETGLARFFASAIEQLNDLQPPGLVCLHTSALGRVWDSPQALRDQYSAEDDPPAAALVEPPSQSLAGNIDPDVLLGLRHAYAGEVTVLDHCLGALLDAIHSSGWSSALLIATACRGYPLGEHGVVGGAADDLYAELLHVPWFVRAPGGEKYGVRLADLVQPADLFATLGDWFTHAGQPAIADPGPWYLGQSLLRAGAGAQQIRKLAVALSATGETALATPAWLVRAPAPSARCDPDSARQLELYVKPDDHFEANEVSDRCLEVTDEFRVILQAFEAALRQGVVPELNLSDALALPLDR